MTKKHQSAFLSVLFALSSLGVLIRGDGSGLSMFGFIVLIIASAFFTSTLFDKDEARTQ
jgi:hypothetical protein